MPELPIAEDSQTAAGALTGASHTRQVLSALVALASDLSGSLDLTEVLGRALQRALALMRAEAGAILLLEADERTLRCEAQFAQDKAILAIGQRLPVGEGIAGRVAATGRLYYTNDPQRDPYFSPAHDQCADIPTQHIVCAPLRARGKLLGVMQVRNRAESGFSPDDAYLFQAFADLAAVAIANSRLHAESLARRRLEREMSLARQIQQGFLPQSFPNVQGVRFEASMEPAAEVGGDFYDIFPLDKDRMVIAIGDVSGKGPSAALYMACLHAELHMAAEFEPSPMAVMARLNRLMFKRSQRGAFITLLLAVLTIAERRLMLLAAGHYPPLLFSTASGVAAAVECHYGYALGMVEEQEFTPTVLRLDPGAGLLFYTDGVFEPQNRQGEEFGLERLSAAFAQASRNRQPFGQCLKQAMSSFGATPNSDDLAFVAFWLED